MSLTRILVGYLVIVPAHLSVSFSNDYFDTYVDSFATPDIFSGGSGVLLLHPELKNTARWIALALIGLSLFLALFLILFYSFPGLFLIFVLIGNFLGWFYSAPPLRFSYRGWGEVSTAIVASLLTCMGYLALNSYMTPHMLVIIPPVTFCSLAFILAVELPDQEADRLGNKKTWVARRGRYFGFASITFLFFISACYFLLIPYVYSRSLPINTYVLFFLSMIPLAAASIGLINKPFQKGTISKMVILIVAALAVYLIAMNAYFFLTWT